MKKIVVMFFVLLLSMLCFSVNALATDTVESFNSGDGSQDNPYIISSIGELLKLAEDVNSGNDYVDTYFELGGDIDLSEIDHWTPIGKDSGMSNHDFDGIPFNGKLDGKGHSIKGLKISHEIDDYTYKFQGLFGCIGENGNVSNLEVDGSVQCYHYAGMLAGQNNGTIDRVCISDGHVNAFNYSGGFVGVNNGTIKNSYTRNNLEVTGRCFVGGIAGDNGYGRVLNCYNSAIVTANINKENNFSAGNAWSGCIVGAGGTVINTYSSTEINVPNNPQQWGQIAVSNYVSKSYFMEGLPNPSNVGIEKSEDEMKTTLASILNANLMDIQDKTLYVWEQGDSYPYLTSKLWIPCVKQVVIDEHPTEILRGNSTEFSYSLDCEYLSEAQKGTTFSIVSKEHAEGTKIDGKKLYIDRNEPQNSITVRLTSDFDPSKYAEISIGIINPSYKGNVEIAPIENVKNGTLLDEIILPNVIKISTDFGQEYASVDWNKEDTSYDKSNTESQEFTLNGIINLPKYTDINEESTDVQIIVKVNAAETKPEIQTGGVSGTITAYNKQMNSFVSCGGVKVQLTRGATNSKVIAETQTDKNGKYVFVNLPNGVYSLVAIRGEQTVTKTVIINNQSINQDMKLPDAKIDTTLVVNGTEAPLVAVDKLDEIIENPENNTEIKLVVEKKAAEEVIAKEQIEEQLQNDEKVGVFLDAELFKFENGKDGDKITQLAPGKKIKITIEIPEELRGKQSYSIIRQHEDLAEKLSSLYNEKMNTITFETDKFSTYVLVYKEVVSNGHRSHKKNSNKSNEAVAKVDQNENISPKIDFPFEDISKNNWAYDAINYVHANGIMNGISKSKFGPDLETTRAMLVKVIWSIENEPVAKNKNSFKDLKKGSYYESAVNWAVENDIVRGYSKEKFAPNDILTREQVAAILYRYSKYKGKQDSSKTDLSYYKDVDKISGWAKEGVQWAVDKKIIQGRKENLISPTEITKRNELAKIIMGFLENSK